MHFNLITKSTYVNEFMKTKQDVSEKLHSKWQKW